MNSQQRPYYTPIKRPKPPVQPGQGAAPSLIIALWDLVVEPKRKPKRPDGK